MSQFHPEQSNTAQAATKTLRQLKPTVQREYKLFLVSLLLIGTLISNSLLAQNSKFPVDHYTIYLGIGSHRSYYSKSDISFHSTGTPSFSFTLNNVRGVDDKGLKLTNGAPQYSYEIGYYNHKSKWGIEFNFDHIKYYVQQFQSVPIKGTINNRYLDQDTTLTPAFIQFEHSDGGNYALVKGTRWQPLWHKPQSSKTLFLLLKAGMGPVIPKTNSTIMGKHWDEAYKISGYVLALETGLRYHFNSFLYASLAAKGAYAHYTRFRIAEGFGNQKWLAFHLGLLAGIQLHPNQK